MFGELREREMIEIWGFTSAGGFLIFQNGIHCACRQVLAQWKWHQVAELGSVGLGISIGSIWVI